MAWLTAKNVSPSTACERAVPTIVAADLRRCAGPEAVERRTARDERALLRIVAAERAHLLPHADDALSERPALERDRLLVMRKSLRTAPSASARASSNEANILSAPRPRIASNGAEPAYCRARAATSGPESRDCGNSSRSGKPSSRTLASGVSIAEAAIANPAMSVLWDDVCPLRVGSRWTTSYS